MVLVNPGDGCDCIESSGACRHHYWTMSPETPRISMNKCRQSIQSWLLLWLSGNIDMQEQSVTISDSLNAHWHNQFVDLWSFSSQILTVFIHACILNIRYIFYFVYWALVGRMYVNKCMWPVKKYMFKRGHIGYFCKIAPYFPNIHHMLPGYRC